MAKVEMNIRIVVCGIAQYRGDIIDVALATHSFILHAKYINGLLLCARKCVCVCVCARECRSSHFKSHSNMPITQSRIKFWEKESKQEKISPFSFYLQFHPGWWVIMYPNILEPEQRAQSVLYYYSYVLCMACVARTKTRRLWTLHRLRELRSNVK